MSEIIKVIISTSFIPIIFRILHWYIRQKSDNKQFSKYYLKLNKTQESIDVKFLNEKCDMIMFFVIKLLVVITTTVILTYAFSENESFISYCYSMNSLRLVKHILDITIAVTFSLIGLLTLFLSLNKEYYLFFTKEDVINKMKIKNHVVNMLLFSFVILGASATLYGMHYEFFLNANAYIGITFIFALIVFAYFIFYVCKLIGAIISLSVFNKTEFSILNKTHYMVRMDSPQPNGNINKEKQNYLSDSIDYLMLKVHPNTIKKEDTITFYNLIDNFFKLPVKYKCLNYIQTFILNILFSLCIFFSSNIVVNSKSIKDSIVGIVLANIVLCLLIFIPKLKCKLQNIYSYLTMSAYGLKIESKSINNQSKVLVICTSPAKWFNKWNKYNKFIINLYNIVAVFKCILSTRDSEMITECYELIIKNDNIDPYLYFLVSYFLYEYDKQQFEKYKKDFGCYLHKNCGSNWKQEEPFIKNLLSILCDITRDEKIYIKVNEFLKFYQS